MRISRDELFMNIAHTVALRSTCPRARVGAIVVNPFKNISSIGYNGNPSGEPHCEDVGCNMVNGHCTAIHAEVNALRFRIPLLGHCDKGYTMYVTHKPCPICEEAIINNGRVLWVIYDIPYRYDGPEDYIRGGVSFERYQGSPVSVMRPL